MLELPLLKYICVYLSKLETTLTLGHISRIYVPISLRIKGSNT